MSTEKKQNILLNSKIAVGIGLVILFVLGLALIGQGFIDTRNYREQIIQAIETQTQKKVTIKGAVRATLLPSPTLYISGLELRDPKSDTPVPAASIDLVSIHVTFASVFSEQPKISAVSLDHPVLELVRAEDKTVHWGWLTPGLLNALMENKDPQNALALSVSNGRVLYHDNTTEKNIALEGVNIAARDGSVLDAQGDFYLYGHEINFTMNKKTGAGFAPFQFRMNSGSSDFVELKGEADTSKDVPEFKGDLALDLADAMIWLHPRQSDEKLIDVVTQRSGKKEKIILPLKINSNWAQQGLSVTMDNFHLEGLNSIGTGKLQLTWDEWKPKINLDMAFSSLDADQWRKYLSAAFITPHGDIYSKVYHGDDELPDNPLAGNISLSVNFIAEKVKFGSQNWGNARLSATWADSSITVNQFGILLPGDTSLTMFGVVTPSANNDLRFEGSMETKGKSLREMLTVFDESAVGLPETGLGDFSARSNIFVSSEQLRLSDADVKLTELHLNGGLVAYFDNTVRLEADVKLKNINFDYFRDAWRTQREKTENTDFFLKFNQSADFSWLKKLQATIDFKVGVDHFTFLDHDGDNASFRVFASSGDLGIYDINFIYPNDVVKGHFKLNVNGEQPLIDLALSAGALDTGYFNVDSRQAAASKPPSLALPRIEREREFMLIPDAQAADEPTLPPRPATGLDDLIKNPKSKTPQAANAITHRWSEDLIDMSWMNGLSGVIDLDIGRLTHKDLTFDNLKLKTKFGNNLMVFDTLTFSYWGGQCSILGSLYGGKVPGFVISLSLTEMHLDKMLKDLIDRDNVSGNVSLNASLNSSGVNVISWVSQAEGKMVLVGRGVTVKGLNLPGVVEAVSVSRTASDVVDSVSRRLVDVATTFSVDGNVNVKNGMLRTPGITLRSDAIVGDLVGEVKLVNWTMDLSTLFQFPQLSSETVPTMSVQLSGPLKSGEMRTDTASLEAFVAKRIISK